MGKFRRFVEGVIHLPVVHQTHSYDCGAAALRAVALYYGLGPDREGDFIKALDTSETQGTDPDDIVRVAKEIGLHAGKHTGMGLEALFRLVDDKKPVIVAIQAYGDDYSNLNDGHYVVVMGHDDRNVFFQDPSVRGEKSRGHASHEDFLRRWADKDRDGKVLKQLGIVVWAEKRPENPEVVAKSKRVD